MKFAATATISTEEQEDQMEPKAGEKSLANEVIPATKWSRVQVALSDYVAHAILHHWELCNGKVPCEQIPLYWRRFRDDCLLEIHSERFSGNGSKLAFSFRQEELMDEYRSGEPFRLPLERLRPVRGDVFGFGWVDELAREMPEAETQGEPDAEKKPTGALITGALEAPVSFLTGEMYYISLGPSRVRFKHRELDARFLVTEQAVFDWKQHRFATSQVLVRLHLSKTQKEKLLSEPDSELYRLMTREDVVRQLWASWPEAVRSGTDIYAVLDLEEGRKLGLIHEELLLG